MLRRSISRNGYFGWLRARQEVIAILPEEMFNAAQYLAGGRPISSIALRLCEHHAR
jgi:hypothetical protein